MNYNTDGFHERSIYIHNANDLNRIKKQGSSNTNNISNRMRIEKNRSNVKTANNDINILKEEARGLRENFVLRNNNMRNANKAVNPNNPVSNAMNRNIFKKF